MKSDTKLPPLDEEVFDGDHQSANISAMPKCTHKNVKFINGELRCTCGAAWMGSHLHELYKLLISQ